MTLQEAETWLYHLGDVSAARAAEIGASNADVVVTEWADYAQGEAPYDATRLNEMRGEGDKIVLSYLSIGEAEPYRYYWDVEWETDAGRPDWVGTANPEWVDNIRVRFWDPDWQEIVFDYAERIVAQGFDGLYLDIVSAYEFWEKRDRAPGIDARAEMAAFVAELRERVDAVADGSFYIVGQNALELTADATYFDAIDGVAKEDLRFYYEYGRPEDFGLWPNDEYRYHRELLAEAEAAGKATFVVEYIPPEGVFDDKARDRLGKEVADLAEIGTPVFVATDRDLTMLPEQPDAIETGVFPPFQAIPDPESTTTYEGTGGSDRLTGTDADEVFYGRGSSDDLIGKNGADSLYGGAGQDELFGGGGRDVLDGGLGLDELSGGGGRDTLLGGDQADLLRGQAGADLVLGGKGHDELFGGGGADTLTGGKGGDLLTGGGGRDVFVFRSGSGEDEILDFDLSRDKLDLGRADPTVVPLPDGAYLALSASSGVLLRGVDPSDITQDVFL